MSIDAYFNPDFTVAQKLSFLGIAFIGVFLVIMVILGGVRLFTRGKTRKEIKVEIFDNSHNRVQRFYEMIISATSVMVFSCSYVIINHIYSNLHLDAYAAEYEKYKWFVNMWDNSKDFILLLLICISCLLNTVLDRLIIPLKKLSKQEKASVRLLGMFYVILVLMYLNVIGDESEYSPVVLYYLGLMVGRFVYFDASFTDFLHAIKEAFKNIYLLILGLLISGFMCFYGFDKGYLLERNYYLVGAFYVHLFLLTAVFIIHHSHLLYLLVRKPKGYEEIKSYLEDESVDEYEEYEEYDPADVYEEDEDLEYYENEDDFY